MIAGKLYDAETLMTILGFGAGSVMPPTAAPEFDPLSDPLDEPFPEEYR